MIDLFLHFRNQENPFEFVSLVFHSIYTYSQQLRTSRLFQASRNKEMT